MTNANLLKKVKQIKTYTSNIRAYLKEIDNILDNDNIDYDALFDIEKQVDRLVENADNLKTTVLNSYDELDE
jgi:ribosomal 50S subunit-associated protein YjgA (DUF615 family)